VSAAPRFLALAAPEISPLAGNDVTSALRGLLAVFVVLGLVALCAWLVRRGALGALGRKSPATVCVETAVPLGERRSLMVVTVEGRRLLLGLTPQQVTLLTELAGVGRPPSFDESLTRATGGQS
jgi:flagellar protein FliO/FliZ